MNSGNFVSGFSRTVLMGGFLLSLAFVGCRKELPHYEFILPDGYTGWIQVVFLSPIDPEIKFENNKLLMPIDNSGVMKTRSMEASFVGVHDEFLYRRIDAQGKESLIPIPSDYVCPEDSGIDSCFGSDGTISDEFTVSRANLGHANDGTPGNSWFLFVGPPDLRKKFAKPIHRAQGAKYQVDVPEDDPKPGRIRNGN